MLAHLAAQKRVPRKVLHRKIVLHLLAHKLLEHDALVLRKTTGLHFAARRAGQRAHSRRRRAQLRVIKCSGPWGYDDKRRGKRRRVLVDELGGVAVDRKMRKGMPRVGLRRRSAPGCRML